MPDDTHIGARECVAFVVVVALAAALRAYGLTAGGLSLDEGYSLLQSERSLLDIFLLNRFDANPPFYIATLNIWRGLFGDSELALKSLAALAGTAGVVGVWLSARERFGWIAGAAAGLIVSASSFHIHHSQEIRGYSVLFAAVAFADYFFARWRRRGDARALLFWGVASWYAVNTHHFAWYFVGVHAVAILLRPVWPEARKRTWIVVACVVLASAPMLVSFVIHITVHQSQNWIPLRPFSNLVTILGAIAGRPPVAFMVWGLAIIGLAGSLLRMGRASGFDRWIAIPRIDDNHVAVAVPALQLLLPALLWIGSQLFFPMLLPRYCLIALVPLAVLAGGGVALLRSRAVLLGALLIFLVLSRTPIEDLYENEKRFAYVQRWSEIVGADYREGDVVVYTDKHVFVPAVALHPDSMDEFLLGGAAGRNRSSVLDHYTSREVERPPLEPGDYERLWLIKRKNESLQQVLSDGWFAKVEPRLLLHVEESEVYLLKLGSETTGEN